MTATAQTPTHRSSLPFLVILLVFIGYFSISIVQTYAQIEQNRHRLQELQTQVQLLKQQKEDLQNQLSLHQSPSYIEGEARNQLSMAKDGEMVVLFPSNTAVLGASTSATPVSSNQPPLLPGQVAAWQHLFF